MEPTSPTRLLLLVDELLALAHRKPLPERAPYLQTAGRSLALAERRGASATTLRSQREWLQALASETSEIAA
jgi:hypothetical protein